MWHQPLLLQFFVFAYIILAPFVGAYADAKPKLVHTLNASSLALPRLMVAIVETYQKEDGSVELPKKLQDFCDNWW